MFKRITVAIFAAMALCSVAQAQTVVGTDGVKVLGAGSTLAVKKESGGTRAMALYGSGWQYIADDGAHTKYGKLVAACGSRCLAVDNDVDGLVVAVGDSNGVYCIANKSSINFANQGQPLEIADACAFWAKVKANSQ